MRKKEAKKKAAGKKGSIYEEEYLLNTLVKVSTEELPFLQSEFFSCFSVCFYEFPDGLLVVQVTECSYFIIILYSAS